MQSRIECNGLSVARELYELVKNEIAPGAGVDADRFWAEYAKILDDMVPANRFLIEKRNRMHEQINDYYSEHPGAPELRGYKRFLMEIGYLVPEGGSFEITTAKVDPEIAEIAGPEHRAVMRGNRHPLATIARPGPWGIATNDPKLSKRQNPDIAAKKLANLIRAWGHEIEEMLGGKPPYNLIVGKN